MENIQISLQSRFYPHCIVTKVKDGNNIICDVDLGFDDWKMNQSFKLYGLKSPDMNKDPLSPGKLSRAYLRDKVEGHTVSLVVFKIGSRYYVEIVDEHNKSTINTAMIDDGFATIFDHQ